MSISSCRWEAVQVGPGIAGPWRAALRLQSSRSGQAAHAAEQGQLVQPAGAEQAGPRPSSSPLVQRRALADGGKVDGCAACPLHQGADQLAAHAVAAARGWGERAGMRGGCMVVESARPWPHLGAAPLCGSVHQHTASPPRLLLRSCSSHTLHTAQGCAQSAPLLRRCSLSTAAHATAFTRLPATRITPSALGLTAPQAPPPAKPAPAQRRRSAA